MKERIETKINDIIEHILAKPVENMNVDDYNILSSELREALFRESQAESGRRMADLLAAAFPDSAGVRVVK